MLAAARPGWRSPALACAQRWCGAGVRPDGIPPMVWAKVGVDNHRNPQHPVGILKAKTEQYFRDTFKDAAGKPLFVAFDQFHPVVTTKANFDDLLIPKDHISRSKSDTFYVDAEHVLRTQSTAHQSKILADGHNAVVWTADVYRKDEIDRYHYPVFHQTDAVRLWPKSELPQDPAEMTVFVVNDLKATLEGLARHLFGPREIRWDEAATFPFTDPSIELEVDFDDRWVECLGCGMIRPEILEDCGRGDMAGWAFGIGLERLAMIFCQIPDIRIFWSQDRRFLDQYADGELNVFKPFSKYPPVYKDVSFWTPSADFTANDFFVVVREHVQEIVECVEVVDEFTHPKTGKHSLCCRVTYRSLERNLTHDEVNSIHNKLLEAVVDELQVELR